MGERERERGGEGGGRESAGANATQSIHKLITHVYACMSHSLTRACLHVVVYVCVCVCE